MSKNQCHKKVRITVNTFIPGVKGAVKASDGMTTHTIDALVRVDKEGNPIAVCKGPDYEGFVRSFGIDDLQYGVFIKDVSTGVLFFLPPCGPTDTWVGAPGPCPHTYYYYYHTLALSPILTLTVAHRDFSLFLSIWTMPIHSS